MKQGSNINLDKFQKRYTGLLTSKQIAKIAGEALYEAQEKLKEEKAQKQAQEKAKAQKQK